MDSTKVIVTKKRDVRIHGHLWHTANWFLDCGVQDEVGSALMFMSGLVFMAFTLEAYLNWLGSQLIPYWKCLDKLSPKDKLEVIADKVSISVDYSRRPHQIVTELFGFRNEIAHGKPEELVEVRVEQNDEHLDRKLGHLVQTKWERFCTKDNALKARDDVRNVIEQLHASAKFENEFGPFSSGFQLHSADVQR